MTTRNYSSRSQQSTLTSAVTAGATTIVVQSGPALLGGATIAGGTTFTLVVDPDTALEEIVDATAVSTNTFTITRGIDGSSAQAHSAGAVVRHMAIGRDYREATTHIEATTGVHGISNGSSVVGTTDTQTLTNKTLTSPTITNPSISGAGVDASIVFEGATADAYETTLTVVDPTQDNTITLPNTTGTVVIATATQTLTNKTLTSPTISGSPVITGLSSVGMTTSSATPKDYVDSILGSATAASTSAASAATSATSAATSATSAAASASAASASATTAANSATAAATSATSAATSATAAATSATSAANSATTAANSVATIAGYATTASNSASAAATSAASAATSAASAAASTSAAAASATAAATSATSASNSATAAATSATSAATSATAAATSATSAAASAASAAAAVAASFDAKGDLLVGTGLDAFSPLTVAATNGYVLSVNSAAATGLAWIPNDTGDITGVTAGTGLTGGGTSGDVTLNVDTTTIQARVANVTDTEIGYLDGVTSAIQTQLDAKAATANTVSTAGGSTITVASGTTVPLTIQNNGTGNSFVVNDVASDTSALTVDADGLVWVGNNTDLPNIPELNMIVSTETGVGHSLVVRKSNDGGNSSNMSLAKSRGTNSSPTTVQSSDGIGAYCFHAYDGTNYLQVASISATVDGTPGTNDMPTRLNFATTADGAAAHTERMRIDSTGRVQIVNGGVLEAPVVQNAQTGTTYTFVLLDAGKFVTATNASAQTYTIPLNSSVALPVGTVINLIQDGTGQVTIAATSGVTLWSNAATSSSPKTRVRYSALSLVKIGTDFWYCIGDIV